MEGDFILVIPARLESTRLPRKLLREIEEISIIHRTYNCTLQACLAGNLLDLSPNPSSTPIINKI